MKTPKNINCPHHSLEEIMPIVSLKESGAYVLTLPGFLQSDQNELEHMLNRIFAGCISSPYNLALAQQLSLNWCTSKAKKNGLTGKCLCQPTLNPRLS
jgi:hypothetical protein